jgi:hypothetical protein
MVRIVLAIVGRMPAQRQVSGGFSKPVERGRRVHHDLLPHRATEAIFGLMPAIGRLGTIEQRRIGWRQAPCREGRCIIGPRQQGYRRGRGRHAAIRPLSNFTPPS